MDFIKRYIIENDIRTYLKYSDLEKIKANLKAEDLKDYEEQIGWNERVSTLEDYIYDKIQQYNYELALDNDDIKVLLPYIYGCEFDIEINENGKLDMIDLQGAYLGGIESYENFETILDVIDRLSGSFLYDYYGIE